MPRVTFEGPEVIQIVLQMCGLRQGVRMLTGRALQWWWDGSGGIHQYCIVYREWIQGVLYSSLKGELQFKFASKNSSYGFLGVSVE